MKTKATFTIACLALAVMAAAIGSQFMNRPVDAASSESEAKAALVDYMAAFRAKDLDKLMSMYADEAVVMGTGPGERWQGHAEIRAAHIEQFKSYDREESELTWSDGGAKGDVAWGMAMADVTNYYKNVKTEFALNISVVLVKESRNWKVMNIHASNLTDRGESGESLVPGQ